MHAVFTMKGIGKTLEVYADRITLTPKGVLGFFAKKTIGTRTIPFASITGVRLRNSGIASGYLQFTIPGAESGSGLFGAESDENTFVFMGQNELAGQIKDYIEKRLRDARNPGGLTAADIAQELKRLIELKQQGILSDEEFTRAKKRLFQ